MNTKNALEKMEHNRNVTLALREAVKALYFDDNDDYGAALWKITELLGGKEATDLLVVDREAAFQKYVTEAPLF